MQILDPSGAPMMSNNEIEIINNLLRKNQSKLCLEWGSGNSTVYFPKENPFIEEWMAIEHNKTYLELLEKKLPKNSYITIVQNDERYEKYPGVIGKKFDFIFIDGMRRSQCVDEAFNLIKPNGIILLHDAFREESKNILIKYKNKYIKLSDGEKFLKTGFFAHRGLIQFKL